MGDVVDIRDYRKQEAERMTKLEFEARVLYLEGYMDAVHQLRSAKEELVALELDYGPGARNLSGMPGGKKTDGSDRIVARMTARDRMAGIVDRSISTAIKRRDNIERVIDNVTSPKLRSVLRYRYINDKDVGEIAAEMNYSYKQIINLHKDGVRRIKPPRHAINAIKSDLMEDHPDWVEIQVKFA